MARIEFFDNGNVVPADPEATLGTLEILKVLEPRMVYEEDEEGNSVPTGEISERPVECFSTIAGCSVDISFSPDVVLEGLKPFDEISLQGVEFVPWANIDENSMSNYADSGIKIRATGFKQVTALTSKATSTSETKDSPKSK